MDRSDTRRIRALPPTWRIEDRAVHRLKKLLLAGGSFWPRRRLPYVFRGTPVVCRLDYNDVFVVRLCHELQILCQLVDTAVPPRIVGLADDIEGYLRGDKPVEEYRSEERRVG